MRQNNYGRTYPKQGSSPITFRLALSIFVLLRYVTGAVGLPVWQVSVMRTLDNTLNVIITGFCSSVFQLVFS